MNCSYTEEIASNMISIYDNCASIQTANTHLAQTTIDLYHVLTNANNEMDNGLDKASDESNLTTDTDKQWCILQ